MNDEELSTLDAVVALLSRLGPDERRRVVEYIIARFKGSTEQRNEVAIQVNTGALLDCLKRDYE